MFKKYPPEVQFWAIPFALFVPLGGEASFKQGIESSQISQSHIGQARAQPLLCPWPADQEPCSLLLPVFTRLIFLQVAVLRSTSVRHAGGSCSRLYRLYNPVQLYSCTLLNHSMHLCTVQRVTNHGSPNGPHRVGGNQMVNPNYHLTAPKD